MSDVAWLAVLFVISFVCVAYSGWQVLCPMRLRRIRVIWLVSESLRARADTWYWRVILLLGTANCMGITLTIAAEMTNRSRSASFPRVNRVGNEALSFGFTAGVNIAWILQ